MKKKTTIPEDLGHGITTPFFNASDQRFYDLLGDFCKGLPEVKGELKDPETKEKVEWFLSCPDPYTNILLSIGFVLGQKFDLINQEALEEMEFIWEWMREKDWFSLYPRERRSERCLPSMGREK